MHFFKFFLLFLDSFPCAETSAAFGSRKFGRPLSRTEFWQNLYKKMPLWYTYGERRGMKNKRLATVLRFLSCYCIAMGCVTIFSLFEIVFEDKTEGILWGTAITILVVTLLVWNSRL